MPTATAEKTPRQARGEKLIKATPKAADLPHSAKAPRGDNSFAVIETGGKQYGVQEGSTIKIEILNGEHNVGDQIDFDKVLLSENASGVEVGAPYIKGSKVSGSIIEIGRSAKVKVIKYKQKSRYFKKAGHRQPFFKVKITKIA